MGGGGGGYFWVVHGHKKRWSRTCIFDPFFSLILNILDLYGTLKPNNSIRIEHLLLPIHLYYILVKLEHTCDCNRAIMDYFLFLTPFL